MRGDVRTDVPSSSLLAGPLPFPSSQVGAGTASRKPQKTGGTSGAAEREEPEESKRAQQDKGTFEGFGKTKEYNIPHPMFPLVAGREECIVGR